MNHPELEELAALYVAGALTDDQVSEVNRRLADGDSALQAAIEGFNPAAQALYESVAEQQPSDHVRQQLESAVGDGGDSQTDPNPQVWKRWGFDMPDDPLFIRRASELTWEATGIDGIESRRLFVDRDRNQTTMLVRMAPGTAYPRHIHGGPEECYVLEGDLHVGDEVLNAGDYQRAAPGSHHPVQSTKGGCVLLLVSSLSDELE